MDQSDWRATLWRQEKTHEAVKEDPSKNKDNNNSRKENFFMSAGWFQRTDQVTYLLKAQDSLAT